MDDALTISYSTVILLCLMSELQNPVECFCKYIKFDFLSFTYKGSNWKENSGGEPIIKHLQRANYSSSWA